MLQPKRTKFRRVHKMKMKGNANRGAQLAYGTFGIKARVMFEIGGVPYEVAKEALRLAAQKLPVVTKFIVANDFVQPQ